jgi:hypothetical protein
MKYSKCFKKHSQLYFGRIRGEYIVTDGIVILPICNEKLKCCVWQNGSTIEQGLYMIESLDHTLIDNATCVELRSKDTNIITGEKLKENEKNLYVKISYKNGSESELLSVRTVTGYEYLEKICDGWNYNKTENINLDLCLVSKIIDIFKIDELMLSSITAYKSDSVGKTCYRIAMENCDVFFAGVN